MRASIHPVTILEAMPDTMVDHRHNLLQALRQTAR